MAALVYLYLPCHQYEQQHQHRRRRYEGATSRQEGMRIVPSTLCQQQMKMNGQLPRLPLLPFPCVESSPDLPVRTN